MTDAKILLVDDDVNDVDLALASIRQGSLANQVLVLRDGAEALDCLYRRGAFAGADEDLPIVVFLDLHMPKVSGLDVLRQVKGDPRLKTIPVVMFTSSNRAPGVSEAYRLGVNSYVVKPINSDDFAATVNQLFQYWAVANQPHATA